VAREPWELELDRLRDAYRRELPGKLAGLEALLRAAREAGDRESLGAACREAHSLKGSSGSYGFDVASLALQRIEDALGEALAADRPDPAVAWPELERNLMCARDSLIAA